MFFLLRQEFEHYLLAEKFVAHNTAVSYLHDMDQFFDFLTQEKKESIETVSADDVKKYLEFLKKKLKVGAQSASRKLSALKTFIKWGVPRKKFHDFCQGISYPKLGKKLPQFLSEDIIEKLLESAAKDHTLSGQRNKIMICLMYVCGIRVTELIEIKMSQIQFDTGLIRISGKGNKERLVPLPLSVLQILRSYIENIHPKLCTGYMETDYLFPVTYGGKVRCMSRQAFWMLLKKIVKQADIDDHVSPHVLRHSVATHLLKKGANLRLLQMVLGHEQLQTVQVYTHIDISHLRKLYDAKHPRA